VVQTSVVQTSVVQMYFIAHVLPAEINEDILVFKEKMFDLFGCTTGLKSPAHITLVPPFWMKKDLEESLMIHLDSFAAERKCFEVSVRDFDAFKPKTLFLQPVLTPGLSDLKVAADAFIHHYPEFGARVDERKFHPHITIATRDLRKKDFAQAWQLFENKSFFAEWKAKGISLLRHNTKNWEVVHTSKFTDF
jgi:2'-5' RNA ligase